MGDISDRTDGFGNLFLYDPNGMRDFAIAEQRDVLRKHWQDSHAARNVEVTADEDVAPTEENVAWSWAGEPSGIDQARYIDQFRASRSLGPGAAQEPSFTPSRASRFGVWGMYVFWILGVLIAAVASLYLVTKVPSFWPAGSSDFSFEPRFTGQTERTPLLPVRRLVVKPVTIRAAGEDVSLGVSVLGGSDGAVVVINGFPRGSTLSTGHPLEADGWELSAADLDKAIVHPPRHFVGAVDLAVELRLADHTTADLQFMHVEWTRPPRAETLGSSASAPTMKSVGTPTTEGVRAEPGAFESSEPNFHVAPGLDAATIAALIKRGEELVARGDLAGARVLLRRAAEAHDAQAALALGATYDPVVLQKRGVRGIAADIATARTWYEKAKEFGSSEAQARLQSLVSP
jgi:hypothetical protein